MDLKSIENDPKINRDNCGVTPGPSLRPKEVATASSRTNPATERFISVVEANELKKDLGDIKLNLNICKFVTADTVQIVF